MNTASRQILALLAALRSSPMLLEARLSVRFQRQVYLLVDILAEVWGLI